MMKRFETAVGIPGSVMARTLVVAAVLACALASAPAPVAYADEAAPAPEAAATIPAAQDYSAFPDAPALAAPEAIVEDADGNVLFSRLADTSMPMASTTKVMTAVVAMESGVPLDTVYAVSAYAASNQGTVIGYAQGEQVTLLELLEGMLVHSGGDAAVGVAECVAGSEEAFVARMNEKAAELGMTGTHYTSPDGLSDANHYSTPRDMVTLARHAMQIPQIKSIVGAKSVTLTVRGAPVTFTNSDVLLNAYPGMQGLKTGYTYGAGRAFLGTAMRGGQQVWFALLGEESEEARTSDMISLLDWAFSKSAVRALASSGAPALGYATAGYRFGATIALEPDADASLRAKPLDPSLPFVAELTPLTSPERFAMPGQTVGVLSWAADGTLAAARSVTASGPLLPERLYSPFVAAVFYELDAAAVK